MHPGTGNNPVSKSDGVDCITGYVSRSLSKTEHKYLAHKLDFLALEWTFTEQLHEYLYGTILSYTWTIVCSHKSLTSPNWMQWVTTGMLVWQIIILPWAIDQER